MENAIKRKNKRLKDLIDQPKQDVLEELALLKQKQEETMEV